MNNTDEPMTSSAHAPAAMVLTLARVGAVVMAILVVAYLVWDAQVTANPEQVPTVPAAAGTTGDGVQDKDADATTVGLEAAGPEVLMPSSKRGVLMFSSKFAPVDFFGKSNDNGTQAKNPPILLSGSKSALLPSSKVIVLPSSKSGRPFSGGPPDEVKKVPTEKLKNKKGLGKKD